ncbi:Stonustoxin subunit alpha [Merluccius polli]|uniref:Stonustoxin subunit alpha n=1 Tax=Merluccius polli TaxID=89951 RepID=A0AA47MBZ6_MERPO|nr:Stonustoxin subunit alpha [Merluccius polli]
MNHIGRGNVKHPYVFETGQATHVVTGILYGAQAFFVFDREVSEKEDRQNIEGNLKVMINKSSTFKIEGQGSLQMIDKDIANVDKFSCKFHGDFNLEKHPVSFQEAIEVYRSLPKLLGTNGENAVPQKVWLMPLKSLDSAAAQLVRQISERLIRDAQNVLEDLSELQLRCNDVEKCKTTQQFPQIIKKVKAFKGLVSQYKLDFQNIMARKLPLIRGGGEEEGVLAEILKKVHSSPFNSNDLNEWMDYKENEIQIISSLIDKMLNMTIVSSHITLQREIHSEDVRHTVCFVLTSLETPEPYLSALSNYWDETTEPDNVPCAYDVEKEQAWFLSNEIMYKKIKLFKDFTEANKENKSIRFLTAAVRDDGKKGATVHLYKDSNLVNDNFEPPSKPEMITCDITHNSVTLNISPPQFGLAAVTHYTVELSCVHGDNVWQQVMKCKAGDVTVSGLEMNEEYRFRCRAICAVGLGPACEASALTKTLPPSPPEKLQVECYSTELSVRWEKPSDLGRGVKVEHYILEYAETSPGVKPEELTWNNLTCTDTKAIISGLQPSTQYTVRIRCDCGVAGLGKDKTVVVSTSVVKLPLEIKRLAEAVKNEGNKIKDHPGPLEVYSLPLEACPIKVDGCKGYRFGKDSKTSAKPNRTIMVLGATGAGKSTLVNRMINYILGVTWEDRFRFKLVDEDTAKSQAHSQTSEVTVYKLNHRDGFQIDYSLTIVDTPGFGDTRGIERDRMIISQLQNLFSAQHGVSEIDAICFVAQASLARLTPTQKYIFDSVLSIFGNDVAENIRIMVTFTDGRTPPVLTAINESGVPCPKSEDGLPIHFNFNSSALFADKKRDEEDGGGNFDKMFWDMGTKSMKHFFSALNLIETKSLTLTKEVLKQRAQLENSIENLQKKVKLGLAKLEEIKQVSQILQTNEAVITATGKFEYEVRCTKPVQIDISKTGNWSLNCQKCKTTCCYPCHVKLDLTYMCYAMGLSGNCTQCPNNCHHSKHATQKFRWEYKEVKEKRTYQDLKDKYEEATKKKMSVQDIIGKMKVEYDDLQDDVVRLMEEAATCLNTLKEIALKPNPLSTPEYIDLLIEGEKSEATPGYQERIKKLQDIKEKAETMEKVNKRVKLL